MSEIEAYDSRPAPVTTFNVGHFPIPIYEIEKAYWAESLVACAALGLTNPGEILQKLDPGDTKVFYWPKNVLLVEEAGIYELIMTSTHADAVQIKRAFARTIRELRKKGYVVTSGAMDDLDVLQGMLDNIRAARDGAAKALQISGDNKARIEALEGHTGWCSGKAFAKRNKWVDTSRNTLGRLGIRARSIGLSNGLTPVQIPDEREGYVNGWPEWVWEQAAKELGLP